MNELTNLILFKKVGSEDQLNLKTDLTFDGNTVFGVADSLPERLHEGIRAAGQGVSRYNSVVFYDFNTMEKIEVYDLYSTPVSYGDKQIINSEEHQQLVDKYFAD